MSAIHSGEIVRRPCLIDFYNLWCRIYCQEKPSSVVSTNADIKFRIVARCYGQLKPSFLYTKESAFSHNQHLINLSTDRYVWTTCTNTSRIESNMTPASRSKVLQFVAARCLWESAVITVAFAVPESNTLTTMAMSSSGILPKEWQESSRGWGRDSITPSSIRIGTSGV